MEYYEEDFEEAKQNHYAAFDDDEYEEYGGEEDSTDKNRVMRMEELKQTIREAARAK